MFSILGITSTVRSLHQHSRCCTICFLELALKVVESNWLIPVMHLHVKVMVSVRKHNELKNNKNKTKQASNTYCVSIPLLLNQTGIFVLIHAVWWGKQSVFSKPSQQACLKIPSNKYSLLWSLTRLLRTA